MLNNSISKQISQSAAETEDDAIDFGDGTIGGFAAELTGNEEPPVERKVAQAFQLPEAGDGPEERGAIQPIVGEFINPIVPIAGPTKNIGYWNLEELMGHLNRDGESWTETHGTGTVLTVGFPTSIDHLPAHIFAEIEDPEDTGLDAFVAFDVPRKLAAYDALDHWAELTGLQFNEVSPGQEADIYFYGRAYPDSAGIGGQSTGVQENGSEVRINSLGEAWILMEQGKSGYRTLLHEIGHSIGFDHPGDYDVGDNAEYETHAEYIQDSRQYSLMSYFSTDETGASFGDNNIVTARSHDIWVAQKLYGANWDTRDGDTVYGFNVTPDLVGSEYEFSVVGFGGGPHLTIWDAGGDNDWLDLSYDSHDVSLDLNPGTFSSTHGEVDNLSLAHIPYEAIPAGKNVLIENAKGGFGNDYLLGNNADNILEGFHGNDFINGNDGDDTLIGSFGDDTLLGGFGTDHFDGGDGIDMVAFNHSDVDWEIDISGPGPGSASNQYGSEQLISIEEIVGSHGNDLIIGSDEANFLAGGKGNDTIEGGDGADTINGGADHDRIFGGMGPDVLDGGNGVDELYYKYATGDWDIDMMTGEASSSHGDSDEFVNFEKVIGGNGFDEIAGDTNNNVIMGGGGFDQLFGRAGSDYLNGEDGNDTLTGGPGDDYKIGGDGEDTARYQYEPSAVYVDLQIVGAQNTLGSGMDTLVDIERVVGTAHDDFLLGDGEDNWLTGLAGDDQMFGRVGDDRLWGGDDNDILEGGLGDDLLFGGDGEDAASYYFATSSVYVWLGATEAYNTVGAGTDTYHDIENIVGSFHSDGLYGDDGNNKIYAGDGNDLLWGYAGIDDLFGGAGNDVLVGGASHDYMDGGEGNDWAHYDGAGDLTVDLADKTEQWTGQGTDKLVNIENVRGWMGDDDLRGDTLNNHIMGLSGDDTLYGGGGEDTLNGGFGNDIIYAGLDGPSDAPDGLKDLENPNDVPSGRFEIGDYTGLLDDEIFNTGQLLGSTPSPVVGASAGNLRSGEGGGARSGNGQTVDDVAQLPGSAPDVIKFIGGWGDDQVFDFTPGADKLDFTNAGGVDDFTDLSLNDTNDGVMITNGDNSVLLHDVEQADLSASDFWF